MGDTGGRVARRWSLGMQAGGWRLEAIGHGARTSPFTLHTSRFTLGPALNGKGVQLQQRPVRPDLFVLIFEQSEKDVEVVGSRIVDPPESQPRLRGLLDALLQVEARRIFLGILRVCKD